MTKECLSKKVKKQINLAVIKTKDRSAIQRELISDACDLANDETVELIGYAIVAIYKDAENVRVEVPEDMTDRRFQTYVKDAFEDFMVPECEE